MNSWIPTAGRFAVRLCIAIAFATTCACADGDDAEPADAGAGPDTGTGTVTGTEPDAIAPADAAPRAQVCGAMPIAEGELQNQAQGTAVFGQVVGGDVGEYDAIGGSNCGVAGVRICLRDTDSCTQSDEAGQFVLADLPLGVDAEITFEKDGFAPTLRLAQLGVIPVNLRQTRMLHEAALHELFASVGATLDHASGWILGFALAPAEAIGSVVLPEGVSMRLSPGERAPIYSLGSPIEGGPSSDALDPELSATRFGGWGLFPEVEPGEYVIRFERDGTLCDFTLPGFGHGIDDEGNVRVKVVAGFATAPVGALCP